jgi:hypothetical protein
MSFNKCELPMSSSDAYRRKVVELYRLANNEANPELSIELQALATAYMRAVLKMKIARPPLDPKKDIDEP